MACNDASRQAYAMRKAGPQLSLEIFLFDFFVRRTARAAPEAPLEAGYKRGVLVQPIVIAAP